MSFCKWQILENGGAGCTATWDDAERAHKPTSTIDHPQVVQPSYAEPYQADWHAITGRPGSTQRPFATAGTPVRSPLDKDVGDIPCLSWRDQGTATSSGTREYQLVRDQ